MIDQYFGIKELHHVVLRAKTPMQFGKRKLEAQEPVLYFENVSMSMLSERSTPIIARGGWANLPRVIWEDRSEVQFTISEGVMSSIEMGILLSASVTEQGVDSPRIVWKREGPFKLKNNNRLFLEHWPVPTEVRKTFIFEYDRDVVQRKVYGELIHGLPDPFDTSKDRPCIEVLSEYADPEKEYIVDYYYQYENEAMIYTIQKERFNGLFTLEGKFYSKDENEGFNYTNLLYMPKVRIVSDINLRLGERADPAVGVFNIIALPEITTDRKNMILEMVRLNEDIDEEF